MLSTSASASSAPCRNCDQSRSLAGIREERRAGTLTSSSRRRSHSSGSIGSGIATFAPAATSAASASGGSQRFSHAIALGRLRASLRSSAHQRRGRLRSAGRRPPGSACARAIASSAARGSSTWMRSMSGRPSTVGPRSPDRLSDPTMITRSIEAESSRKGCGSAAAAPAADDRCDRTRQRRSGGLSLVVEALALEEQLELGGRPRQLEAEAERVAGPRDDV